MACENVDLDMVTALLEAGLDDDASTNSGIYPIMSLAMVDYKNRPKKDRDMAKSLEIAKLLIKKGIEMDTIGPGGLLPWELARNSGNEKLCHKLMTPEIK